MSAAQRVTFASVLCDPDFQTLVAQYQSHAAAELSQAAPDLSVYAGLDAVPNVSAWEVRYSGKLTGFAVMSLHYRPHSSVVAATVESIFAVVGGMHLRRAMERYAKEQGASILLISAPAGSRASDALVRDGMRICSSVHIKAL